MSILLTTGVFRILCLLLHLKSPECAQLIELSPSGDTTLNFGMQNQAALRISSLPYDTCRLLPGCPSSDKCVTLHCLVCSSGQLLLHSSSPAGLCDCCAPLLTTTPLYILTLQCLPIPGGMHLSHWLNLGQGVIPVCHSTSASPVPTIPAPPLHSDRAVPWHCRIWRLKVSGSSTSVDFCNIGLQGLSSCLLVWRACG